MPILGKIVLVGTIAAIGGWFYTSPKIAALVSVTIVVIVVGSTIVERRRTDRFRAERDDTICEFRRSFNIREVDPWIIRATHEAFGAWFDVDGPQFPLRATDNLEDDLRIDDEDIADLANEVAERAGYDLSDCESNPLYGEVKTVEDFVMFFTHQPKIR